jgi:hypothetical protein
MARRLKPSCHFSFRSAVVVFEGLVQGAGTPACCIIQYKQIVLLYVCQPEPFTIVKHPFFISPSPVNTGYLYFNYVMGTTLYTSGLII